MKSEVKNIQVKVLPASVANPFVKKHHYSGKVVQNSNLHFGCFLNGVLHGVMSFGPSMDKRRMLGLVETNNKGEAQKWNEFLELNRMAFDDVPVIPFSEIDKIGAGMYKGEKISREERHNKKEPEGSN